MTLIELIVVLSIMGIIFAIGIPAYTKWKTRYDLENDIKEIYSMVNDARIRSFMEKRVCGIVWGTSPFSNISLKCDTNNDGNITDTGAEIIKTLSLKNKFVSTLTYVKFSNGIAQNYLNIHPQNNNILSNETCVSISITRVRIGEWDGTSCN